MIYLMIFLLRGNEEAKTKVKRLEEESNEVFSTVINIIKLYIGIVAVDCISGKRIETTRIFLSN